MKFQILVDWMTALIGIIIGQNIDGWNSQWIVGLNNWVVFFVVVFMVHLTTNKEKTVSA